jgi:hypothetical protein
MAPQPLAHWEMVWSRKPLTYKMWHTGAPLTPARLPLTSRDAFRSAGAPRERVRATGVAGKWRRNHLKRLNPGREMVWSRKPLTYKIWYTRATDRARLRLTRMGRR